MGQSIWSLLILPLLAVSSEQAQAGEYPNTDVPFRFTATVDAVHLNVSVVKKNGRLVTDLSKEDFRVVEDNIHQRIVYFARGAGKRFGLVHSGFTLGALGMDIYRFD